jgi:hypothetical protein
MLCPSHATLQDPDLDYILRYALLARRRASRPDPFAATVGAYRVN